MEKISGILPSNRRITTVDRQGEHPLRSGHGANFGSKISESEVVSRGKPKLTINEAPKMFQKISDNKRRDLAHAKIVERMSNDFFGKKKEGSPAPVAQVSQPLTQMEVKTKVEDVMADRNYGSSLLPAEEFGEFTMAVEAEKENDPRFHTVGSNLSVVA